MKKNRVPTDPAVNGHKHRRESGPSVLLKTPTGIRGLDDIMDGGLPTGRPTLVCGNAGSGKTLLAVEFLVRGAVEYEEPGILIGFEENGEELAQNMASLGFDLNDLVARKKLLIDFIRVDRNEMVETGEFTLDGLIARLGYAIDSIGAKRVVVDSLETLLSGLTNMSILRAEFRRLFEWLKSKGVTAMITAERGDGTLTRHGMEEYVSDCVILLDHRVQSQFATRRLRIVKYRGSSHGADEYPFLIGPGGISVLPMTSLGLAHVASTERILSGIPRLDAMLGGNGYYQGSSILASGTAGSGKTSLAVSLVDATCRRGERCVMFLFEESPSQLIRNMRSIGVDLEPWVKNGLLLLHAARPTLCGLEMHLVTMRKVTEDFKPSVVVIDPVTNLESGGTAIEARALLTRLIDFFKTNHVTTFFTSLTSGGQDEHTSEVSIASQMDTWLLVRELETNGERNRLLYVLKSRGMAHSNQVREFRLTDSGIDLVDVYIGPGGVLTGTARVVQAAREASDDLVRQRELAYRRQELDRKHQLLQAQMDALRLELEGAEQERSRIGSQERERETTQVHDRAVMAQARSSDSVRPKSSEEKEMSVAHAGA
jgi:circadian clock protein KaiC